MPEFCSLSPKQRAVFTWWYPNSPYAEMDAIICDGAVRSGKTVCMAVSFVLWACATFHDRSFALCGKTITSLRRNIGVELMETLQGMGFACVDKRRDNVIEVSGRGCRNRFYLFGGQNEGSAALIQGVTLAGVLFDEVALMPRSFVEQALARCSAEKARYWFNCNPESPRHWFYQEWIQQAGQKRALYLHFTMKDNPSLSPEVRKRYENLYSGTFYERYILGKWVGVSGLVYPMFSYENHVFSGEQRCGRFYISCDYGTVNPTSMGLWGESGGRWYRLREFYYDSRLEQYLKTDEEYYADLCALAGDFPLEAVIVDPSAASFLECIRRHGRYCAVPAANEVVTGVRRVGELLREGRLRFHESCRDCIREFSQYCWEEQRRGEQPKKQNDHTMDELRYFVNTVLFQPEEEFFVLAAERR